MNPKIEILYDGQDLCVVVDGLKIAKRGRANTPEAGKWVTLVQGWTVTSPADHSEITVEHDGRRVH